jgi:hypothetical protein
MERPLMTWERKILRKIYGPAYENGYWRIKMYQEMHNKLKSADILTIIEVRRLERLGNFIGIESKRTVKKLLEGKPGRV